MTQDSDKKSFQEKLRQRHQLKLQPGATHQQARKVMQKIQQVRLQPGATQEQARKAFKKIQQVVGVTQEMSFFTKLRRFIVMAGLASTATVTVVLLLLYVFLTATLPAHDKLRDYQPKTSTRVHAGDGKLLAEFAVERRIFLPIAAIPEDVKLAFISAEDKNFYNHKGLDFIGIVRAMKTNVENLVSGDGNLVGASTITQQVAKNFLLTREQTFTRKFKEAIIARRIEKALSKDRILELYLNEIYLGNRSYGVAAAAADYFGKALDEINIAEAALLAALPKAPSSYNPKVNPERARERRDWVLDRMYSNGYLNEQEHDAARKQPIYLPRKLTGNRAYASYFVEELRRSLLEDIGKEELYGGGLTIRSTLDPTLQTYAEQALFDGLMKYDRRHGYRGALGHLPTDNQHILEFLHNYEKPAGAPQEWKIALVTNVQNKSASLIFADESKGVLDYDSLRWARRYILPKVQEQLKTRKTDQELLEDAGVIDERNLLRRTRPLGAYIYTMSQVVSAGDVILVGNLTNDKGVHQRTAKKTPLYELQQLPDIDGGMLVMDPNTGRVLAMVGGFSFQRSQYNRVTQASRQPGSAFKPFVYLSALEQGFTPATRILDAPFVLSLDNGTKWKPSNYSRKYYGASPMRLGIEQSRNLMTVRLARTLGMEHVRDVAQRFGISERISLYLPNALGSIQTNLMSLTTAYAMLANGGKHVDATLIDRLQDRYGKTLVKHDKRECENCLPEAGWQKGTELPILIDERQQVTDSASAYQIVSMLEGVVARGTGRSVSRNLAGKLLAGKTGTTNNSLDTWFVGFTTDLVAGVYVGHDKPRSLGMYNESVQEAGSTVAVPIFTQFMQKALAKRSPAPFRIPPDVQLVRINPQTGALSRLGDASSIVEAFKPGTQPVDYNTASLLIGDNTSVTTPNDNQTGDGAGQDLNDLLNQSTPDTGNGDDESNDLDQEAEQDELQGIY